MSMCIRESATNKMKHGYLIVESPYLLSESSPVWAHSSWFRTWISSEPVQAHHGSAQLSALSLLELLHIIEKVFCNCYTVITYDIWSL